MCGEKTIENKLGREHLSETVGAFLIPIFERSVIFMGLFSGLFMSRDAPKNSTTGSACRYREDSGKEKAVDHPLYFLLHDEQIRK